MFIPDLLSHHTLLDFTIYYGKLPDPWWGLWEDREEYYDKDGELKPKMVKRMKTGNFEFRLGKLPRSIGLGGMQDEKAYLWSFQT